VMTAPDRDDLVVLVGHPDHKQWWHNLTWPAPVRILHNGTWHDATARTIRAGDPAHPATALAYAAHHPRTPTGPDEVYVRISPPTTHAARQVRTKVPADGAVGD